MKVAIVNLCRNTGERLVVKYDNATFVIPRGKTHLIGSLFPREVALVGETPTDPRSPHLLPDPVVRYPVRVAYHGEVASMGKKLRIAPRDYQPTKADMEEPIGLEFSEDSTIEERVRFLMRPVELVEDPDWRKQQGPEGS